MLTIFTLPKSYVDNITVIQRNALKSWTLLNPRPEIILLGDDDGVCDVATELGVRYEPDIEYNELDTPLVSSLFERGQELASNDLMMYINADIILMSDFNSALADFLERFGDRANFLGIGERWDIDITEPLDFSEGWEARLRADVHERAERHGPTGIDYFLFKRGLYKDVPRFAIGRWAWDNWLVSNALRQSVPVVNMTNRILAVHQNHGHNHKSQDEIENNRSMMKGVPAKHAVHATHTMEAKDG